MSHHNSDLEYPPVFHDKSKWEEPPGDPYLTLWDVNRTPRTVEALDPNHRLRLPVKVLHPDFRCPICCGYLKKTTTVMECMHRFCEECIETSIRLAKKECPTCRIRIPSRRSLRSDKRFDKLIECILGDAEEQDQKEAQEIELFNQGNLMGYRTMQARQRNRITPPALTKRDAKGDVAVPFVPFPPISGFEVMPSWEVYCYCHVEVLRLTYYMYLCTIMLYIAVAPCNVFSCTTRSREALGSIAQGQHSNEWQSSNFRSTKFPKS
jgi:hypothetical protein